MKMEENKVVLKGNPRMYWDSWYGDQLCLYPYLGVSGCGKNATLVVGLKSDVTGAIFPWKMRGRQRVIQAYRAMLLLEEIEEIDPTTAVLGGCIAVFSEEDLSEVELEYINILKLQFGERFTLEDACIRIKRGFPNSSDLMKLVTDVHSQGVVIDYLELALKMEGRGIPTDTNLMEAIRRKYEEHEASKDKRSLWDRLMKWFHS